MDFQITCTFTFPFIEKVLKAIGSRFMNNAEQNVTTPSSQLDKIPVLSYRTQPLAWAKSGLALCSSFCPVLPLQFLVY